MDKLSNAKIAQVMTDAAATIRAQKEKIASLEAICEARTIRDRAEKVAAEIQRKGLVGSELDADVLIGQLQKAAEQNKLDTIEAAVKFVAPNMGQKIAQVSTDDQEQAPGLSMFENFVMGRVG